jgi:hypothetical protein
MSRSFSCSIAVVALVSLLTGRAAAVVGTASVTPASVKKDGSRFSVTAETRDDGLIHFKITYRLPAPQYLVAHFEVRDGETVVANSDTPSFVREGSATYHLAVSPKHLAGSTFELSENSFAESGGTPVPLPGGMIYQIDLQAFGKDAPAAKAG